MKLKQLLLLLLCAVPLAIMAAPVIDVEDNVCIFIDEEKWQPGIGFAATKSGRYKGPGMIEVANCEASINHHRNGTVSGSTWIVVEYPRGEIPINRDSKLNGDEYREVCEIEDRDGDIYHTYDWEQRMDVTKVVVDAETKSQNCSRMDYMSGKCKRRELPDRLSVIRYELDCDNAQLVQRAE